MDDPNVEDAGIQPAEAQVLEPDTPVTKQKKNKAPTVIEQKLLEALENNAMRRERQVQQQNERNFEDDDDKLFLLSLLPGLRMVPAHLKFAARMEMMQVMNRFVMHAPTPAPPVSIPFTSFASAFTTASISSPTSSTFYTNLQTTSDHAGTSQNSITLHTENNTVCAPNYMSSGCSQQPHTSLPASHQTSQTQLPLPSPEYVDSPANSIRSYISHFSDDSEVSLY